MKIKILVLISCVLFGYFSSAQLHSPNLLKWDESEKLRWEHFLVTENNGRFAAECHTFFKASFFLENDSVFCQVITYLNKDSSWRKPVFKKDDVYSINHEQIHFDITEIFARKIRKALIQNFVNEQQVKQVYSDNAKACRQFQDQYDNETRHSLDRKAQLEWNKKIRRMLVTLRDFKEQDIYIKNPWCKLCWKDSPKIASSSK